MENTAVIGLMVPAVAGCMCAIFFCFWYYNRQDRAARLFAGAFALCALGFFLNHFVLPKETLANAVIHNACYALGLYLLIAGMCRAFGRTVPRGMLASLGVVSVFAAGWIELNYDGLGTRIVTINMIHGIMLVIGTLRLWGIWRQNWTGTAVYTSLWLCILNFMVVSPMTVLDVYVSAEAFFNSAYWRTMNVISTFSVLATGGSLIAVCVMERLEALRHDAECDYLTGLKTRRAFEEAARSYCEARSGEVAASLVLIDIDHFKSINDKHGHAIGDAVISAFGDFLERQTRRSDLVGRVGGEEFCLLLPGTDTTGARQLAARLKERLPHLRIPGLPEKDQITASFGVAELGARTAFAEVYPMADAALYAAKTRGRNRVVCTSPPNDVGTPIRRERFPRHHQSSATEAERAAS